MSLKDMKILDKKTPIYALSFLLLSATNVYASTCAEPSPLKVKLADRYIAQDMGYVADQTKTPVLNQQIHQTKAIFNDLTHRSFKRGSGVRYICKGKGDNVRMETTEFRLEELLWSTTLDGNIAVRAWENSERNIKMGTINIAPAPIWNMTNNDTATSVILTRSLNPYLNTPYELLYDNYLYLNGYVYQPADFERENLMDFPDRSAYRLKEIRTDIKRSKKGITLRQSIFINGERAEWVVWDLYS